ncbi:hypothetical protein D915_008698 [Fasciola hepatica]|uniref:Uncharacterized protein n=1 Tax=Fasciola hepatica TaxID=6192 RepID=A0A4E0RXB2_FASHE|nr:hypothetical protein D915_008698 [Fasciola hepatica]
MQSNYNLSDCNQLTTPTGLSPQSQDADNVLNPTEPDIDKIFQSALDLMQIPGVFATSPPYSNLTVELQGVKSQLSDLRYLCASIHSNLLRLSSNPTSAASSVASPMNPTASCTFSTPTYCAPTLTTSSQVQPEIGGQCIRSVHPSPLSASISFRSAQPVDLSSLVPDRSIKCERRIHSMTSTTCSPVCSLDLRSSALQKQRRRSTGSLIDPIFKSDTLLGVQCSSVPVEIQTSSDKIQQDNVRQLDEIMKLRSHAAESLKNLSADQIRPENKASVDGPVPSIPPTDSVHPHLNSAETDAVTEPHQPAHSSPSAVAVGESVAENNTNLPLVLPLLGVKTPSPSGELPGFLNFLLSQSNNGLSSTHSTALTSGKNETKANSLIDELSNSTATTTIAMCSTTPCVSAPNSIGSSPQPKPLALTTEVVSQLSAGQLNPLGQTLLLLAHTVAPTYHSISNFSPTGVTTDSSSSPSVSVAPVARLPTSGKQSGIDSTPFIPSKPTSNLIAVNSGEPGTGTKSNLTDSVARNPQPDKIDSMEVTDKQVGRTSSNRVTLVYERPSTDEVVRVAKSLDNLDTDILRTQVKEVSLNQHSYLFGRWWLLFYFYTTLSYKRISRLLGCL